MEGKKGVRKVVRDTFEFAGVCLLVAVTLELFRFCEAAILHYDDEKWWTLPALFACWLLAFPLLFWEHRRTV